MRMNRIQFQPGLSMLAFIERYGTEAQCEAELEQLRWPNGFSCPRCDSTTYGIIRDSRRQRYQCKACRHQTTLTAGTIMQASKISMRVWFLAIYLISQAKTGISAMALMRYLGVSYPTAWLIHHRVMHAMAERESRYKLGGKVQVDDAYLGGEHSGGKVGRGSENKVPFVAAVSLSPQNRPLRVKFSRVIGFTRQAIAEWASFCLMPGTVVVSDGLACFRGVTSAGCVHEPEITGGRLPRGVPELLWVNTMLSNLKTSTSGAYHAFRFGKYTDHYFGAFEFRFNRRSDLATLHERLLNAMIDCLPLPERRLRSEELSC